MLSVVKFFSVSPGTHDFIYPFIFIKHVKVNKQNSPELVGWYYNIY